MCTLEKTLEETEFASQEEYFIGNSQRIFEIKNLIKKIAPTDVPILLIGERGTGKEVAARYIYDQSSRKDKTFLPINCGAIAKTLIESELFGYKNGAFTGACKDKKGYFETTDKGTLFLDEITELPREYLIKLLRVIEYNSFLKVGDNKETKVDVRIIAACQKTEEIPKDLLDRFRYEIELPPLRNNNDNIILLANHFLELFNKEYNKDLQLRDINLTQLINYDWPGNVRELKGVLERFVIDGELHLKNNNSESLQEEIIKRTSPQNSENFLVKEIYKKYIFDINFEIGIKEIEADLIKMTLDKTRSDRGRANISEAARLLNIKRTTLAAKIKNMK